MMGAGEASFVSQYRKTTPLRGLHRAGDTAADLGQSVIVHRGNCGRHQVVNSARSVLLTRAQPLGVCIEGCAPCVRTTGFSL